MPSEVTRPITKANFKNRSHWRCYGLALIVFCMLTTQTVTQTCTSNPSCQPNFKLDGYEKGMKTVINDCTTNGTSSPCAWADAVGPTTPDGVKTYFLACKLATTGPIALCYYSGVPGREFYTLSCIFS